MRCCCQQRMHLGACQGACNVRTCCPKMIVFFVKRVDDAQVHVVPLIGMKRASTAPTVSVAGMQRLPFHNPVLGVRWAACLLPKADPLCFSPRQLTNLHEWSRYTYLCLKTLLSPSLTPLDLLQRVTCCNDLPKPSAR